MSSNNVQDGQGGSNSLFSNVENDEFKQRQNNLFNILLKTEQETIKKDSFLSVSNNQTMSEKIKVHRNIRHEYNHQRNEPKHVRKSDSQNFKIPDSRCISTHRKSFGNKTPDFKMNPHKWTKYSLSSVSDNDLSDKSNTNAALSFLNDLKKHKTLENDSVNMDVGSDNKTSKILFKKKSLSRPNSENQTECANNSGNQDKYVGSKHVMSEYVVGQSNKPKKIKNSDIAKIQVKKSNKEIALDHLYEDEEDE